MVFEIGDIVEPEIIVTFSGVEFDLIGTSGTVIDRQVNGATSSGTNTYLYKVELIDPLVVGSGVNSQTEKIFWFSESELGGEDSTSDLDFNGVSNLVSSGINTTTTNQAIIQETLLQVDTVSPYYTDIGNLLSVASGATNAVTSQDISSGERGDLSVASGVTETSSFNSEVFKELSDNLFGFYTLVSDLENGLKEEEALAAEQEALASADDEANFNVFYETYVDNANSVNLFSVSGTGSEEAITGPSELIDDSDINADLLNAPSIELETD